MFKALLKRIEQMAQTVADLDASITALEAAVASLQANPPVGPDLTNEVSRINAVTAEVTALIPTPAAPSA